MEMLVALYHPDDDVCTMMHGRRPSTVPMAEILDIELRKVRGKRWPQAQISLIRPKL